MAGVSGLVFCPQSRAPQKAYLNYIRTTLNGSTIFKPLRDSIQRLPELWQDFANLQPRIASLEHGLSYARDFSTWIKTGETSGLESNMSGIITLPLLTIIQVVQYVQYLRQSGVTHSEFLHTLHPCGIQGFCAGLMAALVIATSKDDAELLQNAAKAVRISLGIGAFGEVGSDSTSLGSTTMVVRLRSGAEATQITGRFPESYISAKSDPKTISLIAPHSHIPAIQTYIESLGLSFKMVHMRSNIHNPKNKDIAAELLSLCQRSSGLQLPNSEDLQVAVRSNRTGQVLSNCSLTAEIINTILTACCDWDGVINHLAMDLQHSGAQSHTIAMIGLGDCIPLSPFQKHNLDITKLDVMDAVDESKRKTNGYSTSKKDPFPPNSIAVVGAACRLPGASTLEELWNLIARGESRLESLREDRVKLEESFRASQDKDWITGRKWFGNFVDNVDEFNHTFFGISQKEAAYMDPQQRLLLTCAYEAMDACGYLRHHKRENGDPIGCFIGASYTEYCENAAAYGPSAFAATGTIRAFLSGKISYHFGWTGPSEVVDTACSASLVAIHRACRAIQAGDCTMAVAGGVNIITGINNYIDLARAGFLSKSGQCNPFGESADGYCRADGVGLVVLKSLQHAISDRNHILGVIPATATNQGGLSPGITVPHGEAQKALYRQVLRTSGMKAEQITYVESHGTGTQVGDPIEIASIREIFGGPHRSSTLHVGSLKANVGHSETAAGVASLLKVLAMLSHQGIPPQAGFRTLSPKIPALEPDNLRIARELVPWKANMRIACVNSYGASGSNATLLCSEWIKEIDETKQKTKRVSYPIFLSANTQASLIAYAKRLALYISESKKELSIGDISFTLGERRKHLQFRWCTTANSLEELATKLKSGIENGLEIPKTRKPVILAFSGQSKVRIGLDPTLCETYPMFRAHLENCNSILRNLGYPDIMSSLSQTEPVLDVVVLHAGTFAVQYACARCWLDSGLQVDAVIGHSLGELTALAVSGVLSLGDALNLVVKRASLIKAKWGPDTGMMLAVHSDVKTVQRIIASVRTKLGGDDLEIACYNGPSAHIIAGKQSLVIRAEALIENEPQFRGIRHQRLDVTHGFHSRLTEPLLPELISFSNTLAFKEPIIPIETCTKASVTHMAPSYIAQHSRQAVHFTHAIQRLEARLGPSVWLEAGWHTPIISMTKKALVNAEGHSFQALSGSSGAVTNVATSLWKQGISATWWGFLSSDEWKHGHIWLPPCVIQGTRHWLDHVDRAMEAQRYQSQTTNNKAPDCPIPKLVSYMNTAGRDHEFRLCTQSKKYKIVVRGHSVRQRPLCPASMYMESAVMCAQEMGFDFDGQTIQFHNINFHNGLGYEDGRDVRIVLRETSVTGSCEFTVQSSKRDDDRSPKTNHADGRFDILARAPDFRIYEALILERMENLVKDRSAEHLMKRTAYALFSRVVEYADLLKGISSITLASGRAVAEIEVPETTLIKRESTVDRFVDAISLDAFIQVLGLLINTSGNTVGDEIFVATSIGSITMLPCDFRNRKQWSVYAMFSMDGERRAVGDVFVFSRDGKLTIVGSQIAFTKVQASILEGLLDRTSPHRRMSQTYASESKSTVHKAAAILQDEPVITRMVDKPVSGDDRPSLLKSEEPHLQFEAIKKLIASYIGLPVTDVSDGETFGSLGLDSLSAVELADELRSNFNIEVSPSGLLTIQVGQLHEHQLARTESSRMTTSTHHSIADEISFLSNRNGSLTNGLTNGHVKGHAANYPNGHVDAQLKSRYRVETVTYKEVDGIKIPADVFIPLEPPAKSMPIALMIHGGGYLTLSRKAVRPSQTSFLLANGILPISLDYRLCPQVNVIDGAMTDIRDAYAWVRTEVPTLLQKMGIKVDPSKIVIVGWSTGGHLAMTTAWTTPAAGLPPPLAILAFYCPTHYDPSDESLRMGKEYQSRTMSMSVIRKSLGSQPVTSHAFSSTDTSRLGWIKPGDPRSELVLALVKEKNGVALLLDGIPTDGDTLATPRLEHVAAINPLTQVQNGNYRTPTFVIIGDEDEIVPFHTSVNFVNALSMKGIKNGFIPVSGQRHIFDLGLAPGMTEWEDWVAPGYRFLFDMLGIYS